MWNDAFLLLPLKNFTARQSPVPMRYIRVTMRETGAGAGMAIDSSGSMQQREWLVTGIVAAPAEHQ